MRRDIDNLTGLLDRLCSLVECDDVPAERVAEVSLRAVFDTIGRRAYGPLLLAIGLFAVSPLTALPGMTWGTATLTLLVAGQLTLGMPRPWLPRRFLEVRVSSEGLVKAVSAVRPWAKRLDSVLRPRLLWLTRPPLVIGIGAACLVAALATFPLALIPLAPLLPGLAVVLMGLGLTAKDGLLLMLGAGAVAGTLAVALHLFG